MTWLRLIGIVAPVVVAACAGSETGNGARDDKPVEVQMMLLPGADGTLVAPDRSGAAFEIVTATALVERIELVLPEGVTCAEAHDRTIAYEAYCVGTSGRVRVEGPWLFDLVTGESSPSLDALELPLGPVEHVEVRLAPGARDAWTVAAEGLFGDRDFRLELRLSDTIRFDGTDLAIDEVTMRLALDLDPAGWFADLDLAACIAGGGVPVDAQGVLLLDRGAQQSCGPVAAKVGGALRQATKAHFD